MAAKAEPKTASAVETAEMPKVEQKTLTPQQQIIKSYVDSAANDAPRVNVEYEPMTRHEMAIPEGVSKGPEYMYAWLSIPELDKYLYPGSKWELVTRSNHDHLARGRLGRLLGADGAITFRGQNILAFCYRETYEAEQERIVNDYNRKTESAIDVKEKPSEIASVVSEKSLGNISPEYKTNAGVTVSPVQDLPSSGPDFNQPT